MSVVMSSGSSEHLVWLHEPAEARQSFRNTSPFIENTANLCSVESGASLPLLDRPNLEHIDTLSYKSAGAIDRGFLGLEYLRNAIATNVTMGKIPW